MFRSHQQQTRFLLCRTRAAVGRTSSLLPPSSLVVLLPVVVSVWWRRTAARKESLFSSSSHFSYIAQSDRLSFPIASQTDKPAAASTTLLVTPRTLTRRQSRTVGKTKELEIY